MQDSMPSMKEEKAWTKGVIKRSWNELNNNND